MNSYLDHFRSAVRPSRAIVPVLLALCAGPVTQAQEISRDVIIDRDFPEGEPLEKAIDYFTDPTFPSVIVGNVHGGIYLYRSRTHSLEGPWQRTNIVDTGGAYERARPIRLAGDRYPELVASIQNQIVLFENPMNSGGAAIVGRPWPRTVINSTYGCHDIKLSDLDGDGKVDVICSGAVNLRSTAFVAFQNDRKHWRIVYSVAGLSEGVAIIRLGTSAIPHLVGSDRTGNVFWFENPRTKGGDPRTPNWEPHYIGPGNVGNSFAAGKVGKRSVVVTASNEHEGPGGTPDSRGISWYEPSANVRDPWIGHPADASYRDVHEVNFGHWNGGVPYFLVAEQENACDPARPEGQPPSHPGVGCRIAMFQWIEGKLRQTVLAQTSTHNQAVMPWNGGLLMADANHGAYGASKDVHVRLIMPD